MRDDERISRPSRRCRDRRDWRLDRGRPSSSSSVTTLSKAASKANERSDRRRPRPAPWHLHQPGPRGAAAAPGEGFVIIAPNRGARVRPIDQDFVRDIYEIGVLIEPALTRWFVGMATHEDIVELERIQRLIEENNFADQF